MKRIANLMSSSFLFNKEEDGGGGGGAPSNAEESGLVSGLNDFMASNPDAIPSGESTPAKQAPVEEEPDDVAPVAGSEVEDDGDDDLGLPQIGETKPDVVDDKKPDGFDESAFDAETATLLKTLEEKGHPGDVYQKLRTELKELKTNGAASADIQDQLSALTSENETLRKDAERVKAMEERVSSITSRNAELYLEESPDYIAKVKNPHNEITTTVTALATARGIDEEEIWSAMRTKDHAERIQAFDELEKKIGGRYAMSVEQMAGQMREIAKTDADMRENAVAIMEDSKRADNAALGQESIVREKAFKEASSASFIKYSNKIPGFVDSTGNMTDQARAAEARADTVDVNALTEGDLGYMVFSVQALPQALTELKSLQKENRDLRVAAGSKASDSIPVGGANSVKVRKDDHLDDSGQPRGFLDGFVAADFAKGV